jgi:hypothetical protein
MLRRHALFALAFLAFPLSASRAPVDGAGDFGKALDQVQRAVDERRWKDAKAQLGTALGAHVDQAYVRARLDRIRTFVAQCEFELTRPNRGVKGIFVGEVTSYDAKTCEIELRWTKSKLEDGKDAYKPFPSDDFEKTEAGTLLRLPFDGPLTFELSGKSIGQLTPCFVACLEDSRSYTAELDAGSRCVFWRTDGDETKRLAESTNIYNVARAYVLTLLVREDQLEARHNNVRLVTAAKVKGEFGRVGFKDVQDLQKIVVRGKARKSWIDQRVYDHRQEERTEFDATFDVAAALPAWLRK